MENVVDARAYTYAMIIYFCIIVIVAMIGTILFISKKIGLWGIFSKAGEKEWKVLVPVYNQITLLKICKITPWAVLLYLDFIIPIIGFFAGRDVRWATLIMFIGFLAYRFLISIRLGSAYKKGDVISFLTALFPSIFYPILGCSKNEKYTEVQNVKK